VDFPFSRRPLSRIVVRAKSLGVGAILLLVVQLWADEPYKKMLDDPLTFTGAETLDRAADEAEYRIGVFAPDGDDHPVGRDLVRGVALAVEQANSSGGANGKQLVMIRRWADDPWGAGSKEVIRLVFEDRVVALIGGPDAETTHVAEQVATKAHLLLISPVSSDPSLTHARVPWIFRLPPDDAAQAEVLVNDGLAPRSLTAVGVIASADHDGKTFANELEAAMGRRRSGPAFKLAVDPDLHDPGSLADRVKSFAPDGLVIRLRPAVGRRLIAALQSVGVDCPLFLPWIPGLHLVELPPSYGGPVIEVAPFQPPQQCGPYAKLVRSSARRYGVEPSAAMVYGFDAANLVIEALRRGVEGRADLQRQVTELTGLLGASGPIRWDNGGGNTGKPALRDVTRVR
jgi:branched-chain amino acid transport system substrate-binding protein